jgi:hypothetical protein
MESKVWMSLFIVFIMIVSVLGVALNYTTHDPSTESEFKGYKFNQINGQWTGYKDDEKIIISTEPTYLELVSIPKISFSNLNTGKVYFTTNPQDNIPYNALLDIQNNLVPKLNSLALACTQDVPGCENLPLKTCSDASPTTSIIQLQIAETPTVTFNNNCLLIQAPSNSFTMYTDALILQLYGLE